MFDRIKEKIRQQQEAQEQMIRDEKNRLLSLSEKELLIEILFELKRIETTVENGLNDVENSIRFSSN